MNLPLILFSTISLNFPLVLGEFDLSKEKTLSPNCTLVREAFGNASSEFIKCSVEYSRPVTFCEECVGQYTNVLNSYNSMSQVFNNGTPCRNSFISLDRLGIIETLYENSVNLWNRAKCYKCFTTAENGSQTSNHSKEAVEFDKLYKNFTECLTATTDDFVCAICIDAYVLLQNYFFSISNENEKIGSCMDIVDLMNTTWTYWGDKCCKYRRHNEYTFLISAVVVLLATFLFYIVAQVYAKKKQPTIIEQTRFLNTFEAENHRIN